MTPVTDEQGNILEYQSVRSKPQRDCVARAETLYKQLREDKTPRALKLPRIRLAWLMNIVILILLTSLSAISVDLYRDQFVVSAFAALLLLIMTHLYQQRRLKPLLRIAQEAYDNPLMELVYTGHHDEYSAIELALIKRQAETRAIVGRAKETSSDIHHAGCSELTSLERIKDNLSEQELETNMVASAMTEMSQSIRDVAGNATDASGTSRAGE